jgi:hypothetical protein
MSNIVEFPLPTGMVSEEFIAELHSNAFRDLETSLRDCVKMMGITTELMLQSKTEDESLRFAVFHTADMLISLKKNTRIRRQSQAQRSDGRPVSKPGGLLIYFCPIVFGDRLVGLARISGLAFGGLIQGDPFPTEHCGSLSAPQRRPTARGRQSPAPCQW